MLSETSDKPCFKHGRVVLSPGVTALALQGELDALDHFRRHLHGDWGHVHLAFKLPNEAALLDGRRLLSRFFLSQQRELWIVTTRDRSVTTLLLDDEHESFSAELQR